MIVRHSLPKIFHVSLQMFEVFYHFCFKSLQSTQGGSRRFSLPANFAAYLERWFMSQDLDAIYSMVNQYMTSTEHVTCNLTCIPHVTYFILTKENFFLQIHVIWHKFGANQSHCRDGTRTSRN